MPEAEWVNLPGAGHLVTLEAPDATLDAISAWLSRLDLRS
jgi:pimeloyl-ACP methyl ester carboxylesterase